MPLQTTWGWGALLALGLSSGPAWAEIDLTATDACLTERIGQRLNPSSCVDTAHQRCLTTPDDLTASAVLCFRQAREAWDVGIAREMDIIQQSASDRVAAIAAVELRYDLLANLTQCDRMEELAKVGSDATGDQIVRQRAQCEASSSGLVYLRVKMRALSLQ